MKSKIPIIVLIVAVAVLIISICSYSYVKVSNQKKAEAQKIQESTQVKQDNQEKVDAIVEKYGVELVEPLDSLDTGNMTDAELASAYLSKIELEISYNEEEQKATIELYSPYKQIVLYLDEIKLLSLEGDILDCEIAEDLSKVEFSSKPGASYRLSCNSSRLNVEYKIPFTVR